jgi:catechol 2,3-dioxygenase
VHLHVNDLDAAVRFYRDVVGFEVQFLMPTAAFVSAGGYHHHVGANTWRGVGIPPVPAAGVVGLRRYTIVVRDAEELAAVARRAGVDARPELVLRDPAGNELLLRPPL